MSGTPSRPLAALAYFATDRSLPVADFARAAAERGFDAVLLPEHTHIPVGTEAPNPGGGDLPERYRRTLDPYVALSVDDDTLRRSFERFQALGADQVVLDLQAVDGDMLAVLDRYAAVLAAI